MTASRLPTAAVPFVAARRGSPGPSSGGHSPDHPDNPATQRGAVARSGRIGPAQDRHPRIPPRGRPLADDVAAAFGPLAPLITLPEVTDVFLNGPGPAWVDRGSGATADPAIGIGDEQALRELATRLISVGGRHVDEATPCVDVVVGPGIRVHAVLPPVSPAGTLLSIRLPAVDRLTLSDLDAGGTFPAGVLEALVAAVRERANLLVTGAGGSGKTTLLSALLASASPTERIIAVEDVSELRVEHPQFVTLEARQANLEGAGRVGLERLVREALRMRPDRLVLGECRGGEVRELLAALNTGHDGGAGTLHANALDDVPARMEALGALGGLSPAAVARQTVSAIGIVVHLARRAGTRRVVGLGRFVLDGRDRLGIAPIALAGRRDV